MTEHIHYAFGQSSLGEFLAASSEQGLVVFEFVDERGRRVQRLRERFPDAELSEEVEVLLEAARAEQHKKIKAREDGSKSKRS